MRIQGHTLANIIGQNYTDIGTVQESSQKTLDICSSQLTFENNLSEQMINIRTNSSLDELFQGQSDNYCIEPSLKKRTRKKTTTPSKHTQILKKQAVNSGLSYINESGKLIPEKKVLPSCDTSCRFKCIKSITDAIRIEINNKFWKIGNYNLQNQFLASCIRVKEKRTSNKEKHEDDSDEEEVKQNLNSDTNYKRKRRDYVFTINGRELKVCRTMLLTTLNISDSRIKTVVKKLAENNNILTADGRGKHGHRGNKISEFRK